MYKFHGLHWKVTLTRVVETSMSLNRLFEVQWYYLQGELVWFDPGVGHVLPGEVLEYHRAANVLSVQAVIAGKVR